MASLLERRAPIHPNSLKGVLKGFRSECLSKFSQGAESNDLRQYKNIVKNRNKSAHGKHIQVTFEEVRTCHASAKRVIDAFEHALAP